MSNHPRPLCHGETDAAQNKLNQPKIGDRKRHRMIMEEPDCNLDYEQHSIIMNRS